MDLVNRGRNVPRTSRATRPRTVLADTCCYRKLRLLETRVLEKTGWEGPSLAEKVSPMAVCPRYATPSMSMYDRRWVRLKDGPLRLRRRIPASRALRCSPRRHSSSPPPWRSAGWSSAGIGSALYHAPLLRAQAIEERPSILSVRKRRFWCGVPLHEPLAGVRKGYRTTERYRRLVLWACEHFIDLKSVPETYSRSKRR